MQHIRGYTIRPALPSDIPFLPAIEEQANALFNGWNDIIGLDPDSGSHLVPVQTLASAQEEGRLWVAADPDDNPVGFALASPLDGGAHLDELDVLPMHGRRGLGSALVEAVAGWAREHGHPSITLTTFRDIPWNAPLYERLGFRIISDAECGPGLAQIVDHERDGRFGEDTRVAMRRDL